jgi:uncharacterized protein DUF4126
MRLDPSLALALLTGIAIAAACGLRAFLPLLLLGVAARLGWMRLQPGVDWLQSDHALWALGVAAVLEIAADKIPIVDHALDLVATVVRPAAAWFGSFAVLQAWPAPWAQLAALALGGLTLVVHGFKAKLRLGSTATTLGHANPLLSLIEDLASAAMFIVAVLAPVVAVVLVVALIAWLASRRRNPAPAA